MVLLESLNLPLGTRAVDFSIKGIDGRVYSLADFRDAKVLVIIFMCNHCPYVQAVWGRLVSLDERFRARGVQFVGINPNINPDYPEDSFEKMGEYAERYGMGFPYLADEKQEVSREYKAQCTPDIYVFDSDRRLAYHGRIDDSWKDEAKITKKELEESLESLLAGVKPSEDQEPSMGCSIKWLV